MKLQFKHQKFQADAAQAVCDVFAGQPFLTSSYMMDRGFEPNYQLVLPEDGVITGWGNQRIVAELSEDIILRNLNKVQRENQLRPSDSLAGRFNLTVEMETGVGKTYTYTKTIYELNKRYGWSKFIIVVPSVAIREGVYKSLQVTEEHFANDYGKKLRYFIYNSQRLTEIDRFASDDSINVMIINSQAFNARGRDARRIYMQLDEFRSRRPIDIIANTNPILIIDEPQSVEGAATRERLKEFNPLMTLRYSATHKADSVYNMVYRLDALDAYRMKLVKKIAVKGISVSGSTATESYVYLESVNLSKGNPTATIEFDMKGTSGIRKVRRIVGEGYNLFDHSGGLEEYRNGYIVSNIDGRDNSIEFVNQTRLIAGDVQGAIDEEQIRRIQIRETILSHIDRERQLFYRGIKVLSLFFIDLVENYRRYDDAGVAFNGTYADVFEEEYSQIVGDLQRELGNDAYVQYLSSITVSDTHAGYFAIDRQTRQLRNPTMGDRRERVSMNADDYDLIMRDKERLLSMAEPVRFIFSHSALREGWDNPNVFQICTLKHSIAEVRKRQEVGRGLRLSVNQNGERMDVSLLGDDVHRVNVLTVVANESYESFAASLQVEIAEAIADRPVKVTVGLFKGREFIGEDDTTELISEDTAILIYAALMTEDYVKDGTLTEKYYDDVKADVFDLGEQLRKYTYFIINLLDSVYDASATTPEDGRKTNVELLLDQSKLSSSAFLELWSRINARSAYTVHFDTDELIAMCIAELDSRLRVAEAYITVGVGELDEIKSREDLLQGTGFTEKVGAKPVRTALVARDSVKYDLVGKLVAETKLTRQAIVRILTGISETTFDKFKTNPEDFITKAGRLISDQIATVIVKHISYNRLDQTFDTSLFTEPTLRGQIGVNAMAVDRHLYDHLIYDSAKERDFASALDTSALVQLYIKLPGGFYINTPVGKYNPDWAIAFEEGDVKHVYFVAETKGSLHDMQFRNIEKAKISCAREHFKAISSDSVVYDVVTDFDELLDLVLK